MVICHSLCQLSVNTDNTVHRGHFIFLSVLVNINFKKNLRSFINAKAHCSMTHLKQQKSLGFFFRPENADPTATCGLSAHLSHAGTHPYH